MSLNLEPLGHRVLVQMIHESRKTDWGFQKATDTQNSREQGATQIGIIVAIGPNAWLDYAPGDAWAEVGHRVYIAKYAGKDVEAGNEDPYVIINDEDCLCRILEDKEDE